MGLGTHCKEFMVFLRLDDLTPQKDFRPSLGGSSQDL